jgi:outer membrane protein
MKFILGFFLMLVSFFPSAQERWDLQQCVLYAMQNNISVKQSDVQARLVALQVKLNEAGQYPALNFGSNTGFNFGRSINPATNTFEVSSIFFSNFQLQSSVNVFNWFSQRHVIAASRLDKNAAEATLEKARNDIALNVAVAYLQTLLSNEQVGISRIQISQTTLQLEQVRRQVAAGVLPELNVLELEALLARDSAGYIGARATYQQNIILLKALLNLDMVQPFDIEKPSVSSIPIEDLADLQPEKVFAMALNNLPLQKANQFRYRAALKNIEAAKAAGMPSLTAFGNLGSRYSSLFPDQENIVVTPTGKQDTIGAVEISPGIIRYAVRPNFQFATRNLSFGQQVFNVNLSQAIGLNLSVPIFNNRQFKTGIERSRLNAESIKLQSEQDNMVLKQDIYSAYNDAVNAQQRFLAARKGVEASDKAFEFSQKRYNAGLLPSLDLITNQNNLFRARMDAVAAQYEFVFRMKLLEFYKGQGLRLQ